MSVDHADAAAFLNVADPNFAMDSDEVRKARELNWYARTPYGLAVLRYGEMSELITDKRLRQGSHAWPAHNDVTGVFADWWAGILLNRIGEDHRRLRRLVQSAFSPKILKTLQGEFVVLANELLNDLIDDGRCEFMADFSEPYATRVLCLLLGVPAEDWRLIATWATEMGLALGVTFKQDVARIDAATSALMDYARQLISERRANPRDDFLTQLIQESDNADEFPEHELCDMIVLLIFGGIDTTRNQLGLGMQLLIDHPEQWELLAADPSLAGAAVEEVMRLRPTTTWVTREAVEDFEFKGVRIAKGTTVHLFSAAAGTDPRVVPDNGFDITAKRVMHFGFGQGPHFCIGAFVARSDMAVVLREWPRRVRAPRNHGPAIWLADSGNTGPISLNIAFEKRV